MNASRGAVILEYLTVREVSLRLGYSQVHTNRLIHSGQLQAIRTRLGGWLIDPDSVKAFEAQRKARRAAIA